MACHLGQAAYNPAVFTVRSNQIQLVFTGFELREVQDPAPLAKTEARSGIGSQANPYDLIGGSWSR